MAEERAGVIVMGPGGGQTVANPAGGRLTYKARSGQTAGALTAWESTAAPGEGPPLHLHVNEDEFMYVLEGRLLLRLADTDHTAPAGSFVFIPRGVPTHGRTREMVTPAFCSFSRRHRPAWSASSSVPRSCPRTGGWQMPSRLSRATPAWRFSVLRSPDLTLGPESFGPIAQPAMPRDAPPRRGTPALTGQRVSRKPAVTCPDDEQASGSRVLLRDQPTVSGPWLDPPLTQGQRRGASAGLVGRWSPRRCRPNRTCDFRRIRLCMCRSGGFVSCQRLLDAPERPLFLAACAVRAQSARIGGRWDRPRVGDSRASVAIAGDADAAGVEQRDPVLLKGAVAGVGDERRGVEPRSDPPGGPYSRERARIPNALVSSRGVCARLAGP